MVILPPPSLIVSIGPDPPHNRPPFFIEASIFLIPNKIIVQHSYVSRCRLFGSNFQVIKYQYYAKTHPPSMLTSLRQIPEGFVNTKERVVKLIVKKELHFLNVGEKNYQNITNISTFGYLVL